MLLFHVLSYAVVILVNRSFILTLAATSIGCSLFLEFQEDGPAAMTTPNASVDAGIAEAGIAEPGIAEAGTSACDTYAQAVLSDRPTAYFRFEETGAQKSINEVSGSPIAATYGTNAILGAPGILPCSKGIGGSEAETLLVSMLGPVLTGGEVPFTVEAWVRFATDPVKTTLMSSSETGPSGRTTVFLGLGTPNFFRTETWADDQHLLYSLADEAPKSQTWYHVVYGYSETSAKEFLFINGRAAQSGRLKPGVRKVPNDAVTWQANGTLDEVAVYNYALPQPRISAHYVAR